MQGTGLTQGTGPTQGASRDRFIDPFAGDWHVGHRRPRGRADQRPWRLEHRVADTCASNHWAPDNWGSSGESHSARGRPLSGRHSFADGPDSTNDVKIGWPIAAFGQLVTFHPVAATPFNTNAFGTRGFAIGSSDRTRHIEPE